MSQKLIHIGVGGRGKWPINMVPNRDDFDTVGLVDIREDHLETAMGVTGLGESACFRTLDQALNKVACNAVVVATPPALHTEHCLMALRAGKHVLVEKPFTKSLADSKMLVDEAEKHGVTICVSQNAKYNSASVTMNRLIREEAYGKACFGMHIALSWRKKGVHHSGEDTHSYLWERGIHDFDTMRFRFADTPKRMWAHDFNPSWSPYMAGAGAHAWIEFEGGATCGYLCCFESHKKSGMSRIDVEGGTLELEGGKLTLKHRERDEAEEIPLDECPDSTTVIMNKWSDYLRKGIEPEFSGRNNLTTVAMVEGCGVASEEGRVVDFKQYLEEG